MLICIKISQILYRSNIIYIDRIPNTRIGFLANNWQIKRSKYLEQPIQVDELENYEKPCNLSSMSLIL